MQPKAVKSDKTIRNLIYILISLAIISSFILIFLYACKLPGLNLVYEVSMERPGNHYYQVKLKCEGIREEKVDFKMPVWTPGYYMIQDLPKNVTNFEAKDDSGNNLKWHKTSKNTWQVNSGNSKYIEISYEVFADNLSVVSSYLDVGIGFISPTGIFMYIDEKLNTPVTVTFKTHDGWDRINTGLTRLKVDSNIFYAENFDRLYDCPVLIGNQAVYSFEVEGVPHCIAIENPDSSNVKRFLSDLTKVVKSSIDIIGEIPYGHYTFIILSKGGGGLEHLNSTAVTCNGPVADTSDIDSYKNWLAFLAHEYFHLYNVKTIRPISLEPFDYEKENYTNLLWLSEGGTVYYEFLILNRAGVLSREECLEKLKNCIADYENRPGHLYESASLSSFDAWIHFFQPGNDSRNTTISYYDKGAVLSLLLDLKIRYETKNNKTLDDVMRLLFQRYHIEKNRGFTDDEFEEACEEMAGVALDEIFEYANTVNEIDYEKYLNYAGLTISIEPRQVDGIYFGAKVRQGNDNLYLSDVERNSPAWNAGLGTNTAIDLVDNKKINSAEFNKILNLKRPGDIVKLNVTQHNTTRNMEIRLEQKTEVSYEIKVDSALSNQQSKF